MCVIFIVDDKRPSPGMVEAGWKSNPHGGGVGWQEGGLIHWSKGLELEEMQQMALELPFPFVMHFRVPSVGKACPALTHPFTVDDEASTETMGATEGSILFHNGTWRGWVDAMINACLRAGIKIPDGPWSDTRAMAFLAGRLGSTWLDWLDEKVVTMRPGEGKPIIETFGTWKQVGGVWCSNDYWDRHECYRRELPGYVAPVPNRVVAPGKSLGPMHCTSKDDCTCVSCCQERTETAKRINGPVGGPAQVAPFRPAGGSSSSGRDEQDKAQEIAEAFLAQAGHSDPVRAEGPDAGGTQETAGAGGEDRGEVQDLTLISTEELGESDNPQHMIEWVRRLKKGGEAPRLIRFPQGPGDDADRERWLERQRHGIMRAPVM